MKIGNKGKKNINFVFKSEKENIFSNKTSPKFNKNEFKQVLFRKILGKAFFCFAHWSFLIWHAALRKELEFGSLIAHKERWELNSIVPTSYTSKIKDKIIQRVLF